MKDYKITEENAQMLLNALNRLGFIEVKGDSVEHLFISRAWIKQVFESLKEIKEEDKEKES